MNITNILKWSILPVIILWGFIPAFMTEGQMQVVTSTLLMLGLAGVVVLAWYMFKLNLEADKGAVS